MGAAYFIVLDNAEPGFDTSVNGKAVSRDSEAIESITKELGIADINEFCSFASAAAEFGIDPDLPGAQEKWFSTIEGLSWLRALRVHIQNKPSSVKAANRVLADLADYERLLEQAGMINARWHFEIDI